MKLIFQVLNTDLKGLVLETDKEVINIGRSSDNDLVLKENSISRYHATIVQNKQFATLQDRGSRNATEVDGRAVDGTTELVDGAILSFGDVSVRVSAAEPADAISGDEDEITPVGGSVAPFSNSAPGFETHTSGSKVEDAGRVQGVSQSEETQKFASESGIWQDVPHAEKKLWSVLALVLGITAAMILVIFFVNYSGAGDAPVTEIGASLRVGDVKIVEVPSGFVQAGSISPPGKAEVSRALNLNFAVTVQAVSRGRCRADLFNRRGDRIVLHLNIHPKDREGHVYAEPETPQERERAAREKMLIAESLRLNGRIYEAKQLYSEIVDILHAPGAGSSVLGLQRNAERKRSEIAEKIRKRYEELLFDTSALVQTGRYRGAMSRLEDTMELIPDQNDIRHQNARMLRRLLSSRIERDRR